LKRTNRLILLIGVLLAVVAFVGIIVVFNSQSSGGTATTAPTTKPVVVATRDIALGETVTKDVVGTKNIAIDQVTPDEFQDTGLVIGQVARQNITNGQIVVQAMFSGTGAPMIGSDLPAGMRAMPVRVDAITGVGTLILPGDRVDVVMTVKIKLSFLQAGPDPSSPPQPAAIPELEGDSSKVILQNVEVRAILGASGGVATTGASVVDLATNQQIVILGLTTQQAEVLEFVGQDALVKSGQGALSNITLVLRSPLDKSAPDVKTTGIVLKTLITDYGVLPPAILEASLPPTK
jgi:pilus assembly protein CpaB